MTNAQPEASLYDAREPERYLVAPVFGEGAEARFVLVRWADWPQPVLLSLAPPIAGDTLDDAATELVQARLGLQAVGPPRLAERRVPVRMAQPRLGLHATGWLRALVVPVAGEASTDPLLEGCEALALEAAAAALSTEVERMVLRDAAALVGA